MNVMLAADAFSGGARTVEVVPFGRGHIHASFRVSFDDGRHVLLQRFNEAVFPDPDAVTGNISAIADFAARRLGPPGTGESRWRFLTPLPTDTGSLLWRGEGGLWRAYHFIGETTAVDVVGEHSVRQAGQAFGAFHRLLADYDGPPLVRTIPHFHHTPRRLDALEKASAADPRGRRRACRDEVRRILGHRRLAGALVSRQENGDLLTRVVHNDAKLDNVLFDRHTGTALCVVDLDTVMPGVLAFDFGDMVRSMCSGCAEDELDADRIAVREDLFTSLARGYLSTAGGMLTEAERRSLVLGGQVITLEQSARFLTDHLLGDVYYPCEREDHNLRRARVQLCLLESLFDAEERLEEVVEECARDAALE